MPNTGFAVSARIRSSRSLAHAARQLGCDAGRWDPFAFIDQCEQQRGTGTEQEQVLRQVQRIEWDLLFSHCYRLAVGQE